MGRKFFVSGYRDGFVDHALEVRERGVDREGVERTVAEAEVVDTIRGPRSRVRQRDCAVGLDTEDVHMGGDPCVTRGEHPEFVGGRPTGAIIQLVDRYDDARNYIGSYEIKWEKTGARSHAIASKRRVFH
jgi:hypothetical protein